MHEPSPASAPPLLVAIDMGYGHLRPAHALAERLGVSVEHADRPPLAGAGEQRQWQRTRRAYELATRASQTSRASAPLRALLDAVTAIPDLYPNRDLSSPTFATRLLAGKIDKGLGEGMLSILRQRRVPLLTTFYTPAIIADGRVDTPVFCVVTDTDVNRVWVSQKPAETRVRYLVPSRVAWRRLRAYGVPEHQLALTGFPLPHELLGGPDLALLKRNVAARLVRLDPRGAFRDELGREVDHFLGPLDTAGEPRAPLVTFAVGGTGTQSALVRRLLPSLVRPILDGRLRLALVAGLHAELTTRFAHWLDEVGLGAVTGTSVEILSAPDFATYYRDFNALLARTDVLWSKPSELTFYAALGIPLLFTWPVGMHERANRRWAIEHGAGLKQLAPQHAWDWLSDWLSDGTLAGAAWSGFLRLPKLGLYRIVDAVRRGQDNGPG
jgi:hypothetical protein